MSSSFDWGQGNQPSNSSARDMAAEETSVSLLRAVSKDSIKVNSRFRQHVAHTWRVGVQDAMPMQPFDEMQYWKN
ncbi:hypothetical protein shn_00945 [Shinella sp. HZN7]|nr:hypothetical protein shn_00945 [Shinella sp. HZN7]